ncbi:MAG: iron-containing alcohol dehydrogenase [Proteobacteria bacterium]|nr:iron-containing alcohol dehydrogenase [Pseudomonadota bacterium]
MRTSDAAQAPRVQPVWTAAELCSAELGRAAHWTTASLRERVTRALPWPALESALQPLPPLDALIAVGGGTLLDQAKLLRWQYHPELRLIAVPSLWGSGAESSPIAVRNTPSGKQITVDPGLLPDVRVLWPELLEGLTDQRLRDASGDVWAHALEGFLSPLATPELRAELAALMRRMLIVGIGRDPEWLELGAAASAGQARSSVGLVHGIAHVLESALACDARGLRLGHAALCATWLGPVLRHAEQTTGKVGRLLAEYAVDATAVWATAQALGDPARQRQLLPLLRAQWPAILRDRCTRTNCALVRPSALELLIEQEVEGGAR